MDPRRRQAQEQLEQARRYRELIDTVRALLDGHMTLAQERMYTARGHRQFYWVDPAS